MAGLHLGDVKPWVKTAAERVQSTFGISDIGGFRAHGSVANSDHPKGLALDVMTKDTATGNRVAGWAQANAQPLGLTYVIWNRHIWSVSRADEGWRRYTGPVPHTDHVHLSFKPSAPSGGPVADDSSSIVERAVGILTRLLPGGQSAAAAGRAVGESAAAAGNVGELLATLALPSTQLRIWSGVAGGILLILGLVILSREALKS